MSTGISIKGIVDANGVVHRFDHEYLDNNPNIPEIDATLENAGDAADALAAGELVKNIAHGTSAGDGTFAVGDLVSHGAKLYRCIVEIAEAEVWTPAHWTETTVAEEMAARDAELSSLKEDLKQTEDEIIRTAGVVEELECGLTDEVKTALLNCFAKVAWIDAHGQTYYDALEDALNNERTLSSISAIFNQGSAVIYDTDQLYALKQYLTVTATYSDGTSRKVSNYTLDGTLTAGTSTVTVAYNKKVTTFNVTVTHQEKTLESISATFSSSAVITTDNVLDDLRPYLTVRATYSDGSTNIVTNYTLSGSLNVGTNTITVTYSGKTATFTVNVTQAEKTLQSITAVFNQGSAVIYTDSSLNDLKQYLTVTARYSDGTTQTVTGYTLSGTLVAGTSTITASYSGKTATFNVTVTSSKNYLTIEDTENIYGFTGLTLTNGDFEYTSSKRYSIVPLKNSVHKVRAVIRSDTKDDSGSSAPWWAETACTRFIFNKKSDTEYYGTEGDHVYLFTKNASTQAYDATEVSDFATVQRADRYVESGSTVTISVDNGVMTVSDNLGTIMTITNANVIGWWTAEHSVVHVRWEDAEAITRQNWRYLTANDIDFQKGLTDFVVSDGDIEYTGVETSDFEAIIFKPSVKHIEFVYKPDGTQKLRRNGLFRVFIAKSGTSLIGCDAKDVYLFTPNTDDNGYKAVKDESLATVTCSDLAFVNVSSPSWDGYFNNKNVEVIIENGTLTISSEGYYCTYSNAELIGFWPTTSVMQKLYDVKVYE